MAKGRDTMSVRMIQDRLEGYGCQSALEEEQALREITQEIALAALGRTDFFQKAGFQGGTCLRVFYGLHRFSEDLDFALQQPQPTFKLKPYLDQVAKEVKAYGYELELDDRSNAARAVRIAFRKDDSLGHLLRLNHPSAGGRLRKIRIRLEVDTNPPAGAAVETKYLDFPFPSAICVFDPPSLFAGKLHALLCREYLKGRDWFDFIWYTARRTPINYALLAAALRQMGPWKDQRLRVDRAWCVATLRTKIESTDWRQAREDVRRFVQRDELPSLDLWGKEFFLAQAEKLVS
jgi:predicted nucleotidyltransferase component of viral defense system